MKQVLKIIMMLVALTTSAFADGAVQLSLINSVQIVPENEAVTAFRLAMIDKKQYHDIICANETYYQEGADPFYTNSSQLPVNYTDDIFEALELQDELQTKYTGGTVFHIFLGEQVNHIDATRNLVKKITNNFKLPYFTLSPTFSVCPGHGYVNGYHEACPECNQPVEVYSRIVGYLRPISQWNNGKLSEFNIRKTYNMERDSVSSTLN